jgi:hypothetical protein
LYFDINNVPFSGTDFQIPSFKLLIKTSQRCLVYKQRYGLDDQGSIPGSVTDVIFLFATALKSVLGPTQPPIQWVPGVVSPGVKRLEHGADHSPPSSAEVKNTWHYTSTPHYVFMEWCLVKHRDNFTFSFIRQTDRQTLFFHVRIKDPIIVEPNL